LAPLGEGRFTMLGVRSRVEITFKAPRPGASLQMFFVENAGRPSVFEAFKPASYTSQKLAEFGGQYFCPELNTTYSLSPKDDQLLLRTGNWGDFLLSARFLDSFANPAEMGSILFTRSRKRVSGFTIRSGKVRNLKCIKVSVIPEPRREE
jgi:hypothetical protein